LCVLCFDMGRLRRNQAVEHVAAHLNSVLGRDSGEHSGMLCGWRLDCSMWDVG